MVMKDVLELSDQERAQLFRSLADQTIVFQGVDESVKVLRSEDAERTVNLASQLQQKTSTELYETLHAKGSDCHNCTFDELLAKVVATWNLVEVAEKSNNEIALNREASQKVIALWNKASENKTVWNRIGGNKSSEKLTQEEKEAEEVKQAVAKKHAAVKEAVKKAVADKKAHRAAVKEAAAEKQAARKAASPKVH